MAVSLVGGFLKQKSALKNKIKQEEIDFSLFSVFLNYFTFILFFFAELAVVTNFATFLLLFFRLFFSCFVGFFVLLRWLFCWCYCCCVFFFTFLLLFCGFRLMMLYSLLIDTFSFFFSKKERCILSELVLFEISSRSGADRGKFFFFWNERVEFPFEGDGEICIEGVAGSCV